MSVAFRFDNSFARELPAMGTPWPPAPAAQPRLLHFNFELARELGLGLASPAAGGEGSLAEQTAEAAEADEADEAAEAQELANLFSGKRLPEGAQPVAQVYAGHQFGGFSPQLGDGRALLLGELIDVHGKRRDIAFKGSGRTPYSRGGDGKAAVGPMLRELIIGEAMHALGIATTRALAVVATGEMVYRDTALPGAVLTRVAASHLRVGSFEYWAAQQDKAELQRLVDYAVARHDPAWVGRPQRALGLLRGVVQRQAALVAQWMNVGFIHGVMNTDNMTISGETIDYGPCAFLEAADPATVFSSIDHQGRYAYGNQPGIAQWNLVRLAQALLPVMGEDPEAAVKEANAALQAFAPAFAQALLRGQRAKLGLLAAADGDAQAAASQTADDGADAQLVDDWLALLQAQRVDFTWAWRFLADAAAGDDSRLRGLFADADALSPWLARWRERCASGADAATPAEERTRAMKQVSPYLIARNHRVEEALAAATAGDMAPTLALLEALRRPFEEQARWQLLAAPAAAEATACYRTFCGT